MKYGLAPIEDSDAEILILGSLPGEQSLALGQYYGNPKNHFWRLVFCLIGETLPDDYAARCDALKRHNPSLQLECVVYAHELEKTKFWKPLAPLMDVISFWVWGYQHLETLEDSLHQCIELFPGKPILMGCYLRDYPTAAPIPLEAIKRQWNTMAKALADKRIVGYDILGAVLIDGQLEQATWVRDFIKANS